MLELKRASNVDAESLGEFFLVLKNDPSAGGFHPHPLTREYAAHLLQYSGQDLYYVLCSGREILGYGLLRGWDEGFEVPSLGIAVHPNWRGRGLAELMVRFLHAAARLRGARRVRLKVYPSNLSAVSLYRKIGYEFRCKEAGQLVGFFDF